MDVPLPYSPHILLDPKTTPSRLFVKNLPIGNVTKLELHELFSNYGKILAINSQQDFAFIQMSTPAQADAAVKAENTRLFKGQILRVFKARPPDERKYPPESLILPSNVERDPSPDRARTIACLKEPTEAISENERTNDCEIIVLDRCQRAYSELIERNLKKIGLKVDLLFPNETMPHLTLMATIAARGTLYAISVNPQHESKASLTLNILHGEDGGEEHRNIPIDKAILLIGENFEKYISAGGRRQGCGKTESDAEKGVLPTNIENLLSLLAQSKPLTAMQYEVLIKFLATRRTVQVQLEIGTDSTPVQAPSPEAAQLQKRILAIMDQKLKKLSEASGGPKILQDPKVQNALSSLFPSMQF